MKLGSNDISAVKIGSTDVNKIYIGSTEVWSAASFDADYQAVLDYATTQGYTLPSASQQTLQNQLVVDLKNGGIWSKLDTFGVFATDGDSDFALIDWIRLSDYTAVNSPTFTANQGFQGDGASSYIDTNYSLDSGSNYDPSNSIGSFGGWTYYTKSSGGNPIVGGNMSSATVSSIRGGGSDLIMGKQISDFTLTTGLYYLISDGTNATQYINGNIVSSGSTNTQADSENYRGLADSLSYSTDTISIIFSGGDISNEQSDFYNEINTYMTSI